MASLPAQTYIATLTAEPELRYTPGGKPVCDLRLAYNYPVRAEGTERGYADGPGNFFEASAWNHLAEHAATSLAKGDSVIVVGPTRVENFERKDGSKGSKMVVRVDYIGPSLQWNTVQVDRSRRGGGQGSTTTPQQGFAQQTSPQGGFPQGNQFPQNQPSGFAPGGEEPPF